MVVAAHPDDEILGCGAATAKHSAQGDTVWTLILGEGISSRRGLSAAKKARQLKKLKSDSRKANTFLGVKRLILKRFPDNSFDSVPRLDIIHAIEEFVQEFGPDTIYTHSSCDLNIDHQIVSEAVRTACRPLPDGTVRRILAFEVPSSSEWRFDASNVFLANTFIDVHGFLDLKLKALKAYDGEMRPFPHPRSEDYIRALAKIRGGQSGLKAAEAFCLVRGIES